MVTQLNKLLWLFTLVLLSSCSSVPANLTVPAYQQFVLGEKKEDAFSVRLFNTSNYEVKVETRDQNNGVTSAFGLSPKGTTKLGIPANQKAIIINPNRGEVIVQAKISEKVEGMNYQIIDFSEVEDTPRIKLGDMRDAVSDEWKGQLTYKDYSSGTLVTIPCNLKVEQLELGHYKLFFDYPEESDNNTTAEVKVTEDGTMLNGHKVVKREKKAGVLEIITIENGEENGKPGIIFHTYDVGYKTLSIKKEYQTLGSSELQFRNEYVFER